MSLETIWWIQGCDNWLWWGRSTFSMTPRWIVWLDRLRQRAYHKLAFFPCTPVQKAVLFLALDMLWGFWNTYGAVFSRADRRSCGKSFSLAGCRMLVILIKRELPSQQGGFSGWHDRFVCRRWCVISRDRLSTMECQCCVALIAIDRS